MRHIERGYAGTVRGLQLCSSIGQNRPSVTPETGSIELAGLESLKTVRPEFPARETGDAPCFQKRPPIKEIRQSDDLGIF